MQFTRKLTHEEQLKLTPEEEQEYWVYLFAVNEPICQVREFRDNQKNPINQDDKDAAADHSYAHREKEDWWAGVEKKINI